MRSTFSMKDSATFQSMRRTHRRRAAYLGAGALVITAAVLTATVLFTDKDADARIEINGRAPVDEVLSKLQILVPIGEISAGTKLDHNLFREVSFSRTEVPEGALRKEELIGEMYAKANIPAGVPTLRSQISNSAPVGNVADLVRPGYRAATIEVDATSGVEGWATAGAHVDIVVTYLDTADGARKSQIAIEDAVVLSFNRNIERGKEVNDGKVTGTATVTLSLPVMDALKLHTARSMGRISLILRSTDDVRGVGHAEVTPEDFRMKKPAMPSKTAKNSAGFASYVDRNGQTQEFELRDGRSWSPSTMDDIQ